ncbi:MAG: sigma-70 family RNA polymerase sigma factor [Brevinematia bacterium]
MEDKEFFSSLFEEVKDMLVGYFLANGVHNNNVFDLLNETFLLAWKYRNSLKEKSKAKNWLFSIAKNVLKTHKNILKKHRKIITSLDDNITTHQNGNHQEDIEFALSIINKLPQPYRDVFILFYIDEKSIKEISEILGISETNCKVRLFRAREKIKSLLEDPNET